MNNEYLYIMKYKISFVVLLFFMFICSAQQYAKISAAEISFTFVNNDVEGTISGFESSSTLDLDQIENSKLKGSVKVETINTGNSIRNWSLRRSKYFDADTFPTISFESISTEQEGDAIIVKGNLTMKDITKSIKFRFEKKDNQLVGKTALYSSDYGISIKSEREKNKVLVQLVLQLK